MSEVESIALPTVLLEAMFIILIIDAYEEIYFATFDVPGAYLHAEVPEEKIILLKLRGGFIDIVCDINP